MSKKYISNGASNIERGTLSQHFSVGNGDAEYSSISIANKEVQALMNEGAFGEDETLGGGIRSRLGSLEVKKQAMQKKKKHKELLRRLIEDSVRTALEQVRALMDYHREQMEFLQERIQANTNLWHDLQNQQEAIAEQIRVYRETGKVDLDDDGKLKDDVAEKALREYERLKGIKIDREAPDLYLILLEVQADIETRQAQLEDAIEKDEASYEEHKVAYDDAKEIEADLSSNNPNRQSKGLQRLKAMDNDERISTALSSMETNNNPEIKEKIMTAAGLIESDLEASDFSFDFGEEDKTPLPINPPKL